MEAAKCASARSKYILLSTSSYSTPANPDYSLRPHPHPHPTAPTPTLTLALALALALTRYILFLDANCRLHPGTVYAMVQELETDQAAETHRYRPRNMY